MREREGESERARESESKSKSKSESVFFYHGIARYAYAERIHKFP